MAVLGNGLRAASVTAVEDCVLLRLDQEALYELMADRVEVAYGIIHVLVNRINDRMQDLGALQARVQQLVGGRVCFFAGTVPSPRPTGTPHPLGEGPGVRAVFGSNTRRPNEASLPGGNSDS